MPFSSSALLGILLVAISASGMAPGRLAAVAAVPAAAAEASLKHSKKTLGYCGILHCSSVQGSKNLPCHGQKTGVQCSKSFLLFPASGIGPSPDENTSFMV